jgi:hypothetical protein
MHVIPALIQRNVENESVEKIKFAAKNRYKTLKIQRKKLEQFNGDVVAFKRSESKRSAQRAKAKRRKKLFTDLFRKGDIFVRDYDYNSTLKVLQTSIIHSDEETDEDGETVFKKRMRPSFRRSYTRVNDLFSYLTSKIEYKTERREGFEIEKALPEKCESVLSPFRD